VFCLWDLARFLVLLLVSSASAFAQDPGWPRKLEKPGGTVIVYQPQVDEWKDYATITTRVAFSTGSRSPMLSSLHSTRPLPQRWSNCSGPWFRKSSTSQRSNNAKPLGRTALQLRSRIRLPRSSTRNTRTKHAPRAARPPRISIPKYKAVREAPRKPILTSAPLPAVAALGAQAAQAVLDAARPSRVQSRGKSSSPQIPQISGGLDEFTSLDCYF